MFCLQHWASLARKAQSRRRRRKKKEYRYISCVVFNEGSTAVFRSERGPKTKKMLRNTGWDECRWKGKQCITDKVEAKAFAGVAYNNSVRFLWLSQINIFFFFWFNGWRLCHVSSSPRTPTTWSHQSRNTRPACRHLVGFYSHGASHQHKTEVWEPVCMWLFSRSFATTNPGLTWFTQSHVTWRWRPIGLGIDWLRLRVPSVISKQFINSLQSNCLLANGAMSKWNCNWWPARSAKAQ